MNGPALHTGLSLNSPAADDLVVSVENLAEVRDRYDAEKADPDGNDG